MNIAAEDGVTVIATTRSAGRAEQGLAGGKMVVTVN